MLTEDQLRTLARQATCTRGSATSSRPCLKRAMRAARSMRSVVRTTTAW